MLTQGDTVLGRYEVGELLGQGGSATVHRAIDLTLQREVAVKVIDDPTREHVADAREEARLLAAVRHPNVVAIHDVVEHDGTGLIVMELAEGDDLQRRLRDHGPLRADDVVRFVHEVAGALDAAHQAGVIHRDVKPANIVIDTDGRARVTDFGIGRFRGSDEIVGSHIRGSVAYVAPERLRGEPGDLAVDVYALAAVAFELLTGTAPFTGDDPLEVAKAHLELDPPSPSSLRPDLPGSVDVAILRGLAKQPEHRWSSAGAFADALEMAFRPALESTHRRVRVPEAAAAAVVAALVAAVMVVAGPRGAAPLDEGLISEPVPISTVMPAPTATPMAVDEAAADTTAGNGADDVGADQGRGCPEHAKCRGKR